MSLSSRVLAFVASGLLLVGCNLQTNPWVVSLFGPPTLTLEEAYAGTGSGAVMDHSALDGLLRRHVHGYSVDYDGLETEEEVLDSYLSAVAEAPFDALDRDGKLTLLINAYNAFTLKLILDHSPLESIQDIPADERWDAERWTFAGRTVSLASLEHEELRAKFIEPRLHFAINCASVSCPPLRAEAYVADRLEAQLADQMTLMHTDERWLRIEGNTVYLTPLYLWYEADFTQVSGSSLAFAAAARPEVGQGEWTVRWMDYDWSLNAGSE